MVEPLSVASDLLVLTALPTLVVLSVSALSSEDDVFVLSKERLAPSSDDLDKLCGMVLSSLG